MNFLQSFKKSAQAFSNQLKADTKQSHTSFMSTLRGRGTVMHLPTEHIPPHTSFMMGISVAV